MLNPVTHSAKYARSVLIDESFIFQQKHASIDNENDIYQPASFFEGTEQGESVHQDVDQDPDNNETPAPDEYENILPLQTRDITPSQQEVIMQDDDPLLDFDNLTPNELMEDDDAFPESEKEQHGEHNSESSTPPRRSARTHRTGRENWLQKPFSPPDSKQQNMCPKLRLLPAPHQTWLQKQVGTGRLVS